MGRIVWSHQAQKDLDEIHAYISRDSIRYADLFIERIRLRTSVLVQFPNAGRRVPEIRFRKYRELIEDPVRVIYRLAQPRSVVYIVTIVHGRRDLYQTTTR
jgi:toxin ParE1/3/4